MKTAMASSVATIPALCCLLLLCGFALADVNREHPPIFIELLLHAVASDSVADDKLFQGINDYRKSLNLTALLKNGNAACFADQIALYFKGQECSNRTGSDTVLGTEQQIPTYPDLLSNCHLNLTNTRDGVVMPACVLGLVPSIVLSNFTGSQYSEYLNDTKYVGAGIASEMNWIVVVLSTNTPSGSYEEYNSAISYDLRLFFHVFYVLLGLLFITFG